MKKIILAALALAAIVFGFTSCGNEKDDGTLYLYNWTYYTPDSHRYR